MWYVLQTVIIVYLCYLYKSELTPEYSMGHIFLFATLVAYAVTCILAKIIDLLLFLARSVQRCWLAQQRRRLSLRQPGAITPQRTRTKSLRKQ